MLKNYACFLNQTIVKIVEINDNKIHTRFDVPILQDKVLSNIGYQIISKNPFIISNNFSFILVKKLPADDYVLLLFALLNFQEEKAYCKLILQQYFQNKAFNLNLFN